MVPITKEVLNNLPLRGQVMGSYRLTDGEVLVAKVEGQ
jgi:hypothetical protein